MNVILKISLRNLVRQKRRNLLLGMGIAFGMCILVMANALGAGISDLLLNKIGGRVFGHVFVSMSEKDEKKWDIIRDKDRIKQVILDNMDGVKAVHEHVAAYGKALGNGKTMYITILGVEPDEEFYRETAVMSGNLADLDSLTIEHPVALYERMAERLNVQVNDVIRMRFESVYGQVQTAQFTVVAIMKAFNPFLNMLSYCHFKHLKPLMGYQAYETDSLNIVLDHVTDPQQAIDQANRLHNALQPGVAGYQGVVHYNNQQHNVTVLAIAPEENSRQLLELHLRVVNGGLEETLIDEHAVMLSRVTADALGADIGDQIVITYDSTSREEVRSTQYQVGTIFEANDVVTSNMLFIHTEQMYATFFSSPGQHPAQIIRESELFPALLKEWNLLERTVDQTASDKKYRALRLSDWRGAILDVQTIHEFAGEVVMFEKAIGYVTIIGVVILFFIIQIGVINTLRMTIRERTREIGTVRAIGMQRGDVRWCFVTEVLLLTLFACLIGTAAALFLIQGLSTMTLDAGDSEMGFFLLNNHLHFLPQLGDFVRNLIIILGIAFLTAYFPAHRAAKLSVAEALRHYE